MHPDNRGGEPAPASPENFPIVGVGASAGGFEAFTQLLAALPRDIGMAFVLVQHLDPDHASLLTELLARSSRLPVEQIVDDTVVVINHIYVIPQDCTLTIIGGKLRLSPIQLPRTPLRLIDIFFESLAQDQSHYAVGVVLSGNATDGTVGLEAIKAEGGITFAQDDSAKQNSMPRSAAAAGCVDLVLSPTEIANELARIAKHPFIVGQSLLTSAHWSPAPQQEQPGALSSANAPLAQLVDPDYGIILELLRNHSGVDFSLYKPSTIQRRIARRLVLSKQKTLHDYSDFLHGNNQELAALYADVLINVTSFFRNPETFDVLGQQIFPELLKSGGNDSLRCWIVGCASGQEAYSIAITFIEAAERTAVTRKLQIFATDLNDAMLDKARLGWYPKNLLADMSAPRLQRFFAEADGGYQVSKALRDTVLFAHQNLTADPPFSRVDLISCRNLLIYLEPSAQRMAMPTFHYALKPGGFLLLGASESVGGFTDLFHPIDGKHKIYSKKPARIAMPLSTFRKQRGEEPPVFRSPAAPSHVAGIGVPDAVRGELNAQREADRITVSLFAPPGVLVNAELEILQFRGNTGGYLEPASGRATFELLKMVREGMLLPLRSALDLAKKDNRTIRKENIRIKRDAMHHLVNVEVIPLKNLREEFFLVVFEEALPVSATPPSLAELVEQSDLRDPQQRIADLETELAETRDYLRSMNEQVQVANEQFQAANEEVQSANEELTTVNDELSHRNQELNRLNNDLVNLQDAANIGIILLSADLKIRRCSLHAEKLFNLLAADVGRPISHIRHNLDDSAAAPLDLVAICAEVVATLREQECEVREKGGRWFSLRVRPYMTVEHKADGAVIVMMDIDTLKRSEQTVLESEAALSIVDRQKNEFLAMLGHELRNPLAALTHGLDLLGTVAAANPRREELRQMMVRQTNRIGSLLDQLLDIGRVISGKIELANGLVDLLDVARAAVESVGPLLETSHTTMSLTLPNAKVLLVLGDADRLTQIVENLVTNAATYTDRGGQISLVVDAVDDKARIVVRDNGIGISAELLPHIFDLFTQAPRTLERAKGGLGMGLTLVKTLTEMHGGKVTATSNGLGHGSEFVVTLPRLVERHTLDRPAAAAPDTSAPQGRVRRILLVDDEIEMAEMFGELLTLRGHQTMVVNTGRAALDVIATYQPAVVLLDLGLPGMDGYEVARRIRAEHANRDILIIAITGYQKDEQRRKEAGFDHHFTKPVNLEKLLALLELPALES